MCVLGRGEIEIPVGDYRVPYLWNIWFVRWIIGVCEVPDHNSLKLFCIINNFHVSMLQTFCTYGRCTKIFHTDVQDYINSFHAGLGRVSCCSPGSLHDLVGKSECLCMYALRQRALRIWQDVLWLQVTNRHLLLSHLYVWSNIFDFENLFFFYYSRRQPHPK